MKRFGFGKKKDKDQPSGGDSGGNPYAASSQGGGNPYASNSSVSDPYVGGSQGSQQSGGAPPPPYSGGGGDERYRQEKTPAATYGGGRGGGYAGDGDRYGGGNSGYGAGNDRYGGGNDRNAGGSNNGYAAPNDRYGGGGSSDPNPPPTDSPYGRFGGPPASQGSGQNRFEKSPNRQGPPAAGGYGPGSYGKAGGYGQNSYSAEPNQRPGPNSGPNPATDRSKSYGDPRMGQSQQPPPQGQPQNRFGTTESKRAELLRGASNAPTDSNSAYGRPNPRELPGSDRANLFGNAEQPPTGLAQSGGYGGGSGNYGNYGASGEYSGAPRRDLTEEEQEEQDVQALKSQTKQLNTESERSVDRSLAVLNRTREIAFGTLEQLQEQGGRLNNAEGNLIESNVGAIIGRERHVELKHANRSMFNPGARFGNKHKREREKAEAEVVNLQGEKSRYERMGNAEMSAEERRKAAFAGARGKGLYDLSDNEDDEFDYNDTEYTNGMEVSKMLNYRFKISDRCRMTKNI
jgi:hypothetical protein